MALTLAGSLAIPPGAQAEDRGRCTSVLKEYRQTTNGVETGTVSPGEASTRLAKLVDTMRDSRTAEAMMAARSLIRQGSDVPKRIDTMIKRRLGNGKC